MKYQHPTISLDQPVPGQYIITGHAPAAYFIEEVGHVVPGQECHITPEIPSELLQAILDERDETGAALSAQAAGEAVSHRKPAGRARKKAVTSHKEGAK